MLESIRMRAEFEFAAGFRSKPTWSPITFIWFRQTTKRWNVPAQCKQRSCWVETISKLSNSTCSKKSSGCTWKCISHSHVHDSFIYTHRKNIFSHPSVQFRGRRLLCVIVCEWTPVEVHRSWWSQACDRRPIGPVMMLMYHASKYRSTRSPLSNYASIK